MSQEEAVKENIEVAQASKDPVLLAVAYGEAASFYARVAAHGVLAGSPNVKRLATKYQGLASSWEAKALEA